MTRFADIRTTVIKRTGRDPDDAIATPRFLSPFEDVLQTRPRHDVDLGEILRPQHNRASRRGMGRVRSHRRVGGVAIPRDLQPWRGVR